MSGSRARCAGSPSTEAAGPPGAASAASAARPGGNGDGRAATGWGTAGGLARSAISTLDSPTIDAIDAQPGPPPVGRMPIAVSSSGLYE